MTPVLCVGTDPPQSPEERNGVWVLATEQLLQWLSARPLTQRGIPMKNKT